MDMKKWADKMKRALAILLSAAIAASAMPAGSAVPGGAAYAAEAESAEESKALESGNEEDESAKEDADVKEYASDEEAADAKESADEKESASADASKNENEAETEESSFEDASEYESETAESEAAESETAETEASQELLGIDGEFSAEEMPDETLRAYVNEIINYSYYDKTIPIREQIADIKIDKQTLENKNYEKAVRSIKGIELLPNLKNVSFTYQDITDIAPLASLSKLKTADLSYNKVTGIPSLVNLTSLETLKLDGNKIPASEFDDSKMPPSFLEKNKSWRNAADWQSWDTELVFADIYPYSSEKFFFYVEICGVRDYRFSERAWTVTAAFDQKAPHELNVCGGDREKNVFGYMADIPGLELGEHTVALEARENYGGEKITLTAKIMLIPDEPAIREQIWLRPGKYTSIGVEVSVPYRQDETLSEVMLAEHGNHDNIIETKTNTCRISQYNNIEWYEDYFMIQPPPELNWTDSWISGGISFDERQLEGSYDLIVKTNKETYVFENYAVSDYPGPLITGIFVPGTERDMPVYDNHGEYFHLTLWGTHLKTAGFYPVLKLRDGTPATDESVAEEVVGSYVVYRLKKNENFPKNGNLYCDIVTRPGFPEARVNGTTSGRIELNERYDKGFSARICYNSKTKQFILYTDSRVPKGATLKIGLSSSLSSSSIIYDEASGQFTNADASASVTAQGAAVETIIDIRDNEGKPFYESYPSFWEYNRINVAAVMEINGAIYTENIGIASTMCGFGKEPPSSGQIDFNPGGSSFEWKYGVGACAVISWRYQGCTVEIYSNSDGKRLSGFPIGEPKEDGNYYFTKDDLKDIIAQDPDLEKLYKLEIRKDGILVGDSNEGVLNIGYVESGTVPDKPDELEEPDEPDESMFKAGLYQDEDVPMTVQADGSYNMSVGAEPFYLKNDTLGNSRFITYKISDKSVVKMGKISTNNGIAKIPLTPLKAGTALLTVAANSGAKTAKQEFVIRVTHAVGQTEEEKKKLAETISLNRTSVSVNPALSVSDAVIAVYNGFGGTLENAGLAIPTGSKLAGINAEIIQENGKKTNEIRFFAEGGGSAPVSGKGKLRVTLKAGGVVIERVFDINVAVKEIAPLVTVKQLDKLNTFYKDKPGRFSIGSSDGEIEDVTIKAVTASASDALMAKGADYAFDKGMLTINRVPEGTKKLDFSVKIAGYKSEVEKKNIALATETADFKLSASSGTVYIGDNVRMSTSVRLIDKATGMAVDLSSVNVTVENETDAAKTYTAATSGNKLTLSASAAPDSKGDKLELEFTSPDWNESDDFDFTVKGADIAKAALALGKTSLILYNYSDKAAASAETALTLKGGSEELLSGCKIEEIVAGNAVKDQGNTLKAEYKDAEGIVKVSKISDSLKAGLYKFKISLNGSFWQKPLETTLSVKVVNVNMAENSSSRAKATISAKGTIDVLNRAGTPIVITPKFTNIPADAKVTVARLTGDNADLFEIAGRTGRQAAVVLKENAEVSTKPEKPYKLGVIYTIQAGDTELTLTSNSVNVKLAQKKPKVKISGENVFSSTRGDTKTIRLALTNSSGALIGVERIVPMDVLPGDFDYDFSNGRLSLIYTPRGATSSGQSYTLKFLVYPTGRGINEKPLTVSYKVKIAK